MKRKKLLLLVFSILVAAQVLGAPETQKPNGTTEKDNTAVERAKTEAKAMKKCLEDGTKVPVDFAKMAKGIINKDPVATVKAAVDLAKHSVGALMNCPLEQKPSEDKSGFSGAGASGNFVKTTKADKATKKVEPVKPPAVAAPAVAPVPKPAPTSPTRPDGLGRPDKPAREHWDAPDRPGTSRDSKGEKQTMT